MYRPDFWRQQHASRGISGTRRLLADRLATDNGNCRHVIDFSI
jgi:hypothetical protein